MFKLCKATDFSILDDASVKITKKYSEMNEMILTVCKEFQQLHFFSLKLFFQAKKIQLLIIIAYTRRGSFHVFHH